MLPRHGALCTDCTIRHLGWVVRPLRASEHSRCLDDDHEHNAFSMVRYGMQERWWSFNVSCGLLRKLGQISQHVVELRGALLYMGSKHQMQPIHLNDLISN